MPFHLTKAVLASSLFAVKSLAATNMYTVWSSVIFSRTGERTPLWITDGMPVVLTPLGATQSHTAGAYMRDRYFGGYSDNGVGGAPIQGLSANSIDVEQVYIGAQDIQYTAASAQAFLQGFYPPINQTSSDTVQQDDTTPTDNILADGSTVQAPLGNYQYPLIQTYSGNSPESVYLGATNQCPAWGIAATNYEYSEAATNMEKESADFYNKVHTNLLEGVWVEEYTNSYYANYVYDYANYMDVHDSSAASFLSQKTSTGISNLQQLKLYSDQQLNAWLGNLYQVNNMTDEDFSAPIGSISTIAGNFLASQMLGQLQQAIKYQSQYYKLNLLFGDFQPLMSLFALSGMHDVSNKFLGMPHFASMAVFELFSYTDGSGSAPFPAEEDLWVRFFWQNGTGDDYLAYPIFGYSTDSFDMHWSDFQNYMYGLVPIKGDGDWCAQCAPPAQFCAYWDASYSLTADELRFHGPVTPVVAGVIGAIVALVVAGIVFAAVMLIGRFRFYRAYSQKNEVGGYKGSQKLASDKDLVLPKGGASVDAQEVPGSPVRGGHERVGSWELKQNEAGLPNIASQTAERRPSYENDDGPDIGAAPWQKPVQPDERV